MDTSSNQDDSICVNEIIVDTSNNAEENSNLESVPGENMNTQQDSLIENIKQKILNKIESELNMEKDIMELIRITMEEVEKSGLKGLSKKETVMKIIKQIIKAIEIQTELKEQIEHFLNSGLAESAIELIVKASKNELQINNIIDEITDPQILNNTKCCFSIIKHVFKSFSKKSTNASSTETETI